VGPHTSRSYLAAVARKVRDARPDLIAITGDQVDDYARDVVYFAEAFAGLSAPLGVFAVPGNHDVYAGWSAVRAGLEAIGITVLVNDAVEVLRGMGSFWVAGTGDPAGGEAAPDLSRTLARVPEGAFTIALAHNPALWPRLARRGVHLTLSGHTHYGQLSIPSLGWSLASPFLEYAMGAHRLAESLLYINPGTNYWGLPFRIGALPEVTVLMLRRCPGREADRSRHQGQDNSASNSMSATRSGR
jgi:predicted MPP superfamily phosphohydrolase